VPFVINIDMNFSIETFSQSAYNQNLATKKLSTRDIFGEAGKLLK
jgi:hypothetical protein